MRDPSQAETRRYGTGAAGPQFGRSDGCAAHWSSGIARAASAPGPRASFGWIPPCPRRLARLASFASQCAAVAHEAMASHGEIAADFAARLGFGRHVQDAVHYQYERHDGRGPAFHRNAESIPRPTQVLHVPLDAGWPCVRRWATSPT